MLIFSKLKSKLWPKQDKIVRIIELINHARVNRGDITKYSLDYRLKNDHEEYFL